MDDRLRQGDERIPNYINPEFFSFKVHHGGIFVVERGRKSYIGGQVSYSDYEERDKVSLLDLHEIRKKLGLSDVVEFWYKVPGNEYFNIMENDNDVYEMGKCIIDRKIELFVVIPDSNVHNLKDANVGDWDWDCGTFPESGITIEGAHMVEGIGGTLDDGVEMDDSDSDANYEHFSDSDYGLSEEDDMLYQQNVDVNEQYGSKNAKDLLPPTNTNEMRYEEEEEEEGDESDSDDGFGSMDEEEEEGHDQTVNKKYVFRPLKGREEPVFCNGMIFKRRAQLAEAIRQHAILQGKDIKFIKNETTRVRAVCSYKKFTEEELKEGKKGCPWMIFASDSGIPKKTLQIKHYNPNHNCGRVWTNKLMNSSWLARIYFDDIRISPNLKVSEFMEKVGFDFKCRVLVNQCYKAKHKVLRKLEGSQEEQYAKLWDYCHEIVRSNPVVEIENTETWTWFLKHLINDIEIVNEPIWTIISDKQKGLDNAIKHLLPAIEHRHCVRHLHNNFKSAGFSGQSLKDKMWNLARASYVGKFNFLMEKLEKEDPAAFVWLSDPDRNPCHWSRSHFIFTPKCDILLNNLCEPFNKAILFARDKPLLTMLERLRFYLMDRIVKRRDFANKWVDDLGPKIHKKIEKIKSRYGDYHIIPCGEGEFEARHIHWGQYSVNLQKRSCSCRRWELTGIPCEHGALVIAMEGRQPEDYVSDWYSKKTFLTSYKHILHPMNGQDMWEKSGKPPIQPPEFKRQTGRPRKSRRREADESRKNPFKLSRVGVKMTCKKCGKQGHNKRTCKSPVQINPVNNPKQMTSKRGSTSQKMTSNRGTTSQQPPRRSFRPPQMNLK
ncbi:hypothetical protein Vadar_023666 [Vaccinium darrowii]|uniref:Uncharacterized protein n=1 Tax=Vaccinium darrowii TaxID=229202 RepID=A0ACB7XU22_9ERIC|nr:hypothetical protein Vadar_023666 [Vaccinium darrowii]